MPSRLDVQSEFRLSQRWLDRFSRELEKLFGDWLPTTVKARTVLELLKLPHVSFFSYGETLPVLEHGTTDSAGLGYAYETLTAVVANRLQDIELLVSGRSDYVRKASRNGPEIVKDRADANIFISYSHTDKKFVEELRIHLTPFMRSPALSLWDDTKIRPDTDWREEITTAISAADVAILLVSPDYLASDFMMRFELPALLASAEERGLKVVWLAVRQSAYAETPISRFQSLSDPAKPLSTLAGARRDEVLVSVAQRISSLAGQSF